MQHRGEIIKNAIYQSGYPITKIAERLGKSRRWMYQMFENTNVSLDIIIALGKIIHVDFSTEIKELNPNKNSPGKNQERSQKDAEEISYWKTKYLELLAEYHELLKKK
jgi:predicted transcriptional regulator